MKKLGDLTLMEAREFIISCIDGSCSSDYINTDEAIKVLKLKNKYNIDYLISTGQIMPRKRDGFKCNFFSKKELLTYLESKDKKHNGLIHKCKE